MEQKRYKFPLNTSTTCFLCFEEIGKLAIGDNNFHDNKDEICESEILINLENHFDKVVSLQRILNYLEIDLSQIKALSSKSKSLLNRTDIRVNLCCDCKCTVEKISELCLALELIEMKLEHFIESFSGKLNNVENNPSLLDKYKSKIKESEDGQSRKHSKVVKELRQEIARNLVKSSKYQPTIKLTRVKIKQQRQDSTTINSEIFINIKTESSDVPGTSLGEEQESQFEETFGEDLNNEFSIEGESSDDFEARALETNENSLNDNSTHSPPTPSLPITNETCSPSPPRTKVDYKNARSNNGRKWIKNVKTGTFDCLICNTPFLHHNNVLRHYKTVHLLQRYRCELCKNSYAQKGHLTWHQQICKQTLQTRLAKIKAREGNPRRLQFICETCKKRFNSKFNLERHNTAVHLNQRNHACNICQKTFKRLGTLNEHKQAAHLGVKFCCRFCNKPFDSNGGQINHQVRCAKRIKIEVN